MEDYQEIENDELMPGMRIRLKHGAVATLTDVRLFFEPPDPPVRQPDGRILSRVVGTIRHFGLLTVDVTWSGFTATSSSDHPYYSISRGGYVPAQELQVGEFLLNDKDEVVSMQAVGKTKLGMTDLHNVEVEHFHNYYVGQPGGHAVLVHNSAAPGACINTPESVAKQLSEYPVPKGGISIEALQAQLPIINAERAKIGARPITIRKEALANPSEWYYDLKNLIARKRPAPRSICQQRASLVKFRASQQAFLWRPQRVGSPSKPLRADPKFCLSMWKPVKWSCSEC